MIWGRRTTSKLIMTPHVISLPLCFRQMVGVTDITAIPIPGIGYNAMWNNTGIVVCM